MTALSGQTPRRYDVLIVGLGPVGATLAMLLGRKGVSVLAIDRELTIYPLPRAAHVDHEIMRIFQSIGIVAAIQAFVREAPDYEFRARDGATLMRIERHGLTGVSGWPASFNVYQPGIEETIRASLASLPSVCVELGTHFVALAENDAEGAVAHIARDGVVTACAARFVVGADGAWSAVREACGIGLDDYGFDEPWLVLDAIVRDESSFPAMNLQICDPARPTTFVHMGPGRLRWEFMLKPTENADDMMRDDAISALLVPWLGYGHIEIERRAVYRFHGLVAQRWRDRSAFLVGDAAHQMPPFMGQGLCSGLRDVANLAWKLQASLIAAAPDVLLESYQEEREPHVRDVIERAITMGRLVCTLDPERADARDRAMVPAPRIGPPTPFPPLAGGCILKGSPAAGAIFPQPRDAASGRLLDDELGPGAWLIGTGLGERRVSGGLWIVDCDTLPLAMAAPIVDWLEQQGSPAVLVRPDRYVFGTGTAQHLTEAYMRWTVN